MRSIGESTGRGIADMSAAMNEQQAGDTSCRHSTPSYCRCCRAKCHKSAWIAGWRRHHQAQNRNMGPTGVDVAWLTYQAVFTIEQLPFRAGSAILLAAVAAWVQNDDFREQLDLPDQYAVTPNDEQTADLGSSSPSPSRCALSSTPGPINWLGKRWNVAPMTSGWPSIDLNVGDTGQHQVRGKA